MAGVRKSGKLLISLPHRVLANDTYFHFEFRLRRVAAGEKGDAGWQYRLSTADDSNLADSHWMRGAGKRLEILQIFTSVWNDSANQPQGRGAMTRQTSGTIHTEKSKENRNDAKGY